MDTRDVRQQIKDNLTSHRSYLSSYPHQTDATARLSNPQGQSNDYQTTKHRQQAPIQEQNVGESLVEEQLKREQHKCRILQQRLRNKQTFILQLKQFQGELTHAFEQSQLQLQTTKLRLQDLNIECAKLKEEKRELEKLVVHMEYIHMSKNKKQHLLDLQTSDRKSPLIREKFSEREYSTPNLHNRSLPFNRPKAAPNTSQELEMLASKLSCPVQEVVNTFQSISLFIKRLFDMVLSCNPQMSSYNRIKDKLKYSWKWLKLVVKQSVSSNSKQEDNNIQRLQRLLKVNRPKQLYSEVERLVVQNKQYISAIKLAMDFHSMPADSSVKQLQMFLREKLIKR